MSTTAKSVFDSQRDIVQDLLVPEMKSVKVSIDFLRTEMKLRDELLEQLVVLNSKRLEQMVVANSERFGQMVVSNIKRLEQMVNRSILRPEEMVRAGDDRNARAIEGLSKKLDVAIDPPGLVSLEARLPRQ